MKQQTITRLPWLIQVGCEVMKRNIENSTQSFPKTRKCSIIGYNAVLQNTETRNPIMRRDFHIALELKSLHE